MRLTIELGTLYVNNVRMCFVGEKDGSEALQSGSYEVNTIYSHAHGCDLPNAQGLGWIGPSNRPNAPECDIVLGRMRDGNGQVVNCPSYVTKLLALLEDAEERGQSCTLVIA